MRIKICQMMFFAFLVFMPALAYSQDSQPKMNGEHDGRTVVYLTETERAAVFAEMREFLKSIESIVIALSEVDMELVAESARKSGRAAGAHMPETLHHKLPDSFRTLGSDTHRRFDELALDAEQLGDEAHSLTQLGALLGNCVACHASFRIDVK